MRTVSTYLLFASFACGDTDTLMNSKAVFCTAQYCKG